MAAYGDPSTTFLAIIDHHLTEDDLAENPIAREVDAALREAVHFLTMTAGKNGALYACTAALGATRRIVCTWRDSMAALRKARGDAEVGGEQYAERATEDLIRAATAALTPEAQVRGSAECEVLDIFVECVKDQDSVPFETIADITKGAEKAYLLIAETTEDLKKILDAPKTFSSIHVRKPDEPGYDTVIASFTRDTPGVTGDVDEDDWEEQAVYRARAKERAAYLHQTLEGRGNHGHGPGIRYDNEELDFISGLIIISRDGMNWDELVDATNEYFKNKYRMNRKGALHARAKRTRDSLRHQSAFKDRAEWFQWLDAKTDPQNPAISINWAQVGREYLTEDGNPEDGGEAASAEAADVGESPLILQASDNRAMAQAYGFATQPLEAEEEVGSDAMEVDV
ncbi:hypothetical protein BAUCODRAFT_153214 [Baudoinia panamericana UAMH 10762]|uniref:Uncharacterized protein n=1 Tax=Baudoinia panamericana (strain UAMH 10762) TaxID=717646 RepID=M2M175_BAUPA|nr:uncharacterized protein BAUCODRAFT_153214 [Baudoinia panamericana UAMH 10762]EMD00793.1 hypothetical protein BAUCODRAFT_153214 [Baudoinia panamericana UAMH 10762]